jgi:hypothetical protein
MEMILLDWTRMGKSYCLAGVIRQQGALRVVRPLLAQHRDAPVRNVAWSPFLMDGHARWEVFELIHPAPAAPQPPHLEDIWVHSLRPRRSFAPPVQRRAILEATISAADQPFFGTELVTTRSAAYLKPDSGDRSLASIVVPAQQIAFAASFREGTPGPDYRVTLGAPELEGRTLPVQDHFLLQRAELASPNLDGQARAMTLAVRQMGRQVVVRLGLSRAFPSTPVRGPGVCWLMADGFFSFIDPQP